jgi:transcriptional regulator with XRE-family HTH domain
MRTDARRMLDPGTAREIAALIAKRRAQGLTLTVIARRLGISFATAANYEKRAMQQAQETKESHA